MADFDVNKAARALFYETPENGRRSWESLDEGSKSYWRYLARRKQAAKEKEALSRISSDG